MDVKSAARTSAVVVAALLASACSGSNSRTVKQVTAQTSPRSESAPAKAIYARCGTSTFIARASVISHVGQLVGWQVTYLYPPRAAVRPRPGQTTNVTIVETASRPGRAPRLVGGKEITVAGRQVSFHNRTAKTIYTAMWQTGAARYTALADGSTPAALETVIGCLP
jgi:hypothetical protein